MSQLLTESDLRFMLYQNERCQPAAFTDLGACASVAATMLRHYLGSEWMDVHAPESRKASPYMKWNSIADLDSFRRPQRAIDLAQKLFNFQTIAGFEAMVDRFKYEKNIESSVADLDAARSLHICGIPFRFVTPQKSIGCDYDLEATLSNYTVACEVKCKVEGTDMSINTIKNALNHARSQLPDTMPTIVFLRIPERWPSDQEAIKTCICRAIAEIFNSTRRISTVIVRQESWQRVGTGATHLLDSKTFHNERARHSLEKFGGITEPIKFGIWKNLATMLGRDNSRRPLSNFGTITIVST